MILLYLVGIATWDLMVGWGSYMGSVWEGMQFSQSKNALLQLYVIFPGMNCLFFADPGAPFLGPMTLGMGLINANHARDAPRGIL